jgi:hypothetical protein
MSRRFCFALDLKNDPALIAEYRKYHEKIWPEVTQGSKDPGIEDLEIYLLGTRMFMIMKVNQNFSFGKRTRLTRTIRRCKLGSSSYGDSSKRCRKQCQTKNGYAWNVIFQLEA